MSRYRVPVLRVEYGWAHVDADDAGAALDMVRAATDARGPLGMVESEHHGVWRMDGLTIPADVEEVAP